MRHVIWAKDDSFNLINQPRYDMASEVVEIPDDTIVIVWGYDFERPPIGRFEDIRIEDGNVTGEAVWFPNTELRDPEILEKVLQDYRFGGYFNDVRMEAKAGESVNTQIVHATLRAVAIILRDNVTGANPGARV